MLKVSQNSAGEIQKQQNIFLESYDAKLQKISTTWEGIVDSIKNDAAFKSILDVFNVASKTLNLMAKSNPFGSVGNMMTILSLGTKLLEKPINNEIAKTAYNNLQKQRNDTVIQELINSSRSETSFRSQTRKNRNTGVYSSLVSPEREEVHESQYLMRLRSKHLKPVLENRDTLGETYFTKAINTEEESLKMYESAFKKSYEVLTKSVDLTNKILRNPTTGKITDVNLYNEIITGINSRFAALMNHPDSGLNFITDFAKSQHYYDSQRDKIYINDKENFIPLLEAGFQDAIIKKLKAAELKNQKEIKKPTKKSAADEVIDNSIKDVVKPISITTDLVNIYLGNNGTINIHGGKILGDGDKGGTQSPKNETPKGKKESVNDDPKLLEKLCDLLKIDENTRYTRYQNFYRFFGGKELNEQQGQKFIKDRKLFNLQKYNDRKSKGKTFDDPIYAMFDEYMEKGSVNGITDKKQLVDIANEAIGRKYGKKTISKKDNSSIIDAPKGNNENSLATKNEITSPTIKHWLERIQDINNSLEQHLNQLNNPNYKDKAALQVMIDSEKKNIEEFQAKINSMKWELKHQKDDNELDNEIKEISDKENEIENTKSLKEITTADRIRDYKADVEEIAEQEEKKAHKHSEDKMDKGEEKIFRESSMFWNIKNNTDKTTNELLNGLQNSHVLGKSVYESNEDIWKQVRERFNTVRRNRIQNLPENERLSIAYNILNDKIIPNIDRQLENLKSQLPYDDKQKEILNGSDKSAINKLNTTIKQIEALKKDKVKYQNDQLNELQNLGFTNKDIKKIKKDIKDHDIVKYLEQDKTNHINPTSEENQILNSVLLHYFNQNFHGDTRNIEKINAEDLGTVLDNIGLVLSTNRPIDLTYVLEGVNGNNDGKPEGFILSQRDNFESTVTNAIIKGHQHKKLGLGNTRDAGRYKWVAAKRFMQARLGKTINNVKASDLEFALNPKHAEYDSPEAQEFRDIVMKNGTQGETIPNINTIVGGINRLYQKQDWIDQLSEHDQFNDENVDESANAANPLNIDSYNQWAIGGIDLTNPTLLHNIILVLKDARAAITQKLAKEWYEKFGNNEKLQKRFQNKSSKELFAYIYELAEKFVKSSLNGKKGRTLATARGLGLGSSSSLNTAGYTNTSIALDVLDFATNENNFDDEISKYAAKELGRLRNKQGEDRAKHQVEVEAAQDAKRAQEMAEEAKYHQNVEQDYHDNSKLYKAITTESKNKNYWKETHAELSGIGPEAQARYILQKAIALGKAGKSNTKTYELNYDLSDLIVNGKSGATIESKKEAIAEILAYGKEHFNDLTTNYTNTGHYQDKKGNFNFEEWSKTATPEQIAKYKESSEKLKQKALIPNQEKEIQKIQDQFEREAQDKLLEQYKQLFQQIVNTFPEFFNNLNKYIQQKQELLDVNVEAQNKLSKEWRKLDKIPEEKKTKEQKKQQDDILTEWIRLEKEEDNMLSGFHVQYENGKEKIQPNLLSLTNMTKEGTPFQYLLSKVLLQLLKFKPKNLKYDLIDDIIPENNKKGFKESQVNKKFAGPYVPLAQDQELDLNNKEIVKSINLLDTTLKTIIKIFGKEIGQQFINDIQDTTTFSSSIKRKVASDHGFAKGGDIDNKGIIQAAQLSSSVLKPGDPDRYLVQARVADGEVLRIIPKDKVNKLPGYSGGTKGWINGINEWDLMRNAEYYDEVKQLKEKQEKDKIAYLKLHPEVEKQLEKNTKEAIKNYTGSDPEKMAMSNMYLEDEINARREQELQEKFKYLRGHPEVKEQIEKEYQKSIRNYTGSDPEKMALSEGWSINRNLNPNKGERKFLIGEISQLEQLKQNGGHLVNAMRDLWADSDYQRYYIANEFGGLTPAWSLLSAKGLEESNPIPHLTKGGTVNNKGIVTGPGMYDNGNISLSSIPDGVLRPGDPDHYLLQARVADGEALQVIPKKDVKELPGYIKGDNFPVNNLGNVIFNTDSSAYNNIIKLMEEIRSSVDSAAEAAEVIAVKGKTVDANAKSDVQGIKENILYKLLNGDENADPDKKKKKSKKQKAAEEAAAAEKEENYQKKKFKGTQIVEENLGKAASQISNSSIGKGFLDALGKIKSIGWKGITQNYMKSQQAGMTIGTILNGGADAMKNGFEGGPLAALGSVFPTLMATGGSIRTGQLFGENFQGDVMELFDTIKQGGKGLLSGFGEARKNYQENLKQSNENKYKDQLIQAMTAIDPQVPISKMRNATLEQVRQAYQTLSPDIPLEQVQIGAFQKIPNLMNSIKENGLVGGIKNVGSTILQNAKGGIGSIVSGISGGASEMAGGLLKGILGASNPAGWIAMGVSVVKGINQIYQVWKDHMLKLARENASVQIQSAKAYSTANKKLQDLNKQYAENKLSTENYQKSLVDLGKELKDTKLTTMALLGQTTDFNEMLQTKSTEKAQTAVNATNNLLGWSTSFHPLRWMKAAFNTNFSSTSESAKILKDYGIDSNLIATATGGQLTIDQVNSLQNALSKMQSLGIDNNDTNYKTLSRVISQNTKMFKDNKEEIDNTNQSLKDNAEALIQKEIKTNSNIKVEDLMKYYDNLGLSEEDKYNQLASDLQNINKVKAQEAAGKAYALSQGEKINPNKTATYYINKAKYDKLGTVVNDNDTLRYSLDKKTMYDAVSNLSDFELSKEQRSKTIRDLVNQGYNENDILTLLNEGSPDEIRMNAKVLSNNNNKTIRQETAAVKEKYRQAVSDSEQLYNKINSKDTGEDGTKANSALKDKADIQKWAKWIHNKYEQEKNNEIPSAKQEIEDEITKLSSLYGTTDGNPLHDMNLIYSKDEIEQIYNATQAEDALKALNDYNLALNNSKQIYNDAITKLDQYVTDLGNTISGYEDLHTIMNDYNDDQTLTFSNYKKFIDLMKNDKTGAITNAFSIDDSGKMVINEDYQQSILNDQRQQSQQQLSIAWMSRVLTPYKSQNYNYDEIAQEIKDNRSKYENQEYIDKLFAGDIDEKNAVDKYYSQNFLDAVIASTITAGDGSITDDQLQLKLKQVEKNGKLANITSAADFIANMGDIFKGVLTKEQIDHLKQTFGEDGTFVKMIEGFDNMTISTKDMATDAQNARDQQKRLLKYQIDWYADFNQRLQELQHKAKLIDTAMTNQSGTGLVQGYKEKNENLAQQNVEYKNKAAMAKAIQTDTLKRLEAEGFHPNDENGMVEFEKQLGSMKTEGKDVEYERLNTIFTNYKQAIQTEQESWETYYQNMMTMVDNNMKAMTEELDQIRKVASQQIDYLESMNKANQDIRAKYQNQAVIASQAEQKFNIYKDSINADTAEAKLYKYLAENKELYNQTTQTLTSEGANAANEYAKSLGIEGFDIGAVVTNRNDAQTRSNEQQVKLAQDLTKAQEYYNEAYQAYLTEIETTDQRAQQMINHLNVQNSKLSLQKTILTNLKGVGQDYYNAMDNYYNVQSQMNDSLINAYQNEIDVYTNMLEDTEEGTNEYYTLLEKIDTAQNNLYNTASQQISNLYELFNNTVEKATDALENVLNNSTLNSDTISKAIQAEQTAADVYYDNLEKIYQVQTLNYKVTKEINKTMYDAKAQKIYKQYQEELLEYAEEHEQMTETDTTYLEKRLEIAKAEAALEEAQNNKNTMKLVRDTNGNWTYNYVADQTAVDDAKQELLDKKSDLYEWEQTTQDEYRKGAEEAISTLKSSLTSIYEDTSLSDAEKQSQAASARSIYNSAIQKYQSMYDVTSNTMNGAAASFSSSLGESVLSDELSETLQKLNDWIDQTGAMTTSEIYAALKNNSDLNALATQGVSETISDWSTTTGTSVDTNLVNTNLTNVDNTIVNLNNALTTLTNSVNSYSSISDIAKTSTSTLSTSFDETTNEINKFDTKMDTMLTKMERRVESAKEKADNLENAYDSVKTSVQGAGDAITKQTENLGHLMGSGESDVDYTTAVNKFSKALDGLADKIETIIDKGNGTGEGDGKATDNPIETSDITNKTNYSPNSSTAAVKVVNVYTKEQIDSGSYNEMLDKYINDLANGNVKIEQMATGGYTGDWNGNGKLAILDQKELVLNKDDTSNILSAVNIMRGLAAEISTGSLYIPDQAENTNNSSNFTINAEFPNANDVEEIREAILSLPSYASQMTSNV